MDIKEFLDLPHIKAFIANDDLASVYRMLSEGSRGRLSTYLLAHGISAEMILSYVSDTIPGGAFQNCHSLTSIYIPETVTSISGIAFNGCDRLTSITIPDSVVTIGYHAFDSCTNLASVIFEDNSQLTATGDGTFENCSSLTSITIPNNVISIDRFAFNNCSRLRSITIPESVTTIYEFAFSGCANLRDVNFMGSKEQWKQISIKRKNTSLISAKKHFAK